MPLPWTCRVCGLADRVTRLDGLMHLDYVYCERCLLYINTRQSIEDARRYVTGAWYRSVYRNHAAVWARIDAQKASI